MEENNQLINPKATEIEAHRDIHSNESNKSKKWIIATFLVSILSIVISFFQSFYYHYQYDVQQSQLNSIDSLNLEIKKLKQAQKVFADSIHSITFSNDSLKHP